jgi:hypothetical protein
MSCSASISVFGVLPPPRIAHLPGDRFAEAQPIIEFTHQSEATVLGDP